MDDGEKSKAPELLAKGLGVLLGQAIMGPNGPFLFQPLGLNMPEATAVGCILGGLAGYMVTSLIWQRRHGMHTSVAARIRHCFMHKTA